MKVILLCLAALSTAFIVSAQNKNGDSASVIILNQQIDNYVVAKNVKGLDSLYTDDFVFNHGSGKVQNKSAWLASVSNGNFPLRQHDSVTAEMHAGLAIVKGKMNIQRIDKDKTDRYWLKYIRTYIWKQQRWQMISHSTVYEEHSHNP